VCSASADRPCATARFFTLATIRYGVLHGSSCRIVDARSCVRLRRTYVYPGQVMAQAYRDEHSAAERANEQRRAEFDEIAIYVPAFARVRAARLADGVTAAFALMSVVAMATMVALGLMDGLTASAGVMAAGPFSWMLHTALRFGAPLALRPLLEARLLRAAAGSQSAMSWLSRTSARRGRLSLAALCAFAIPWVYAATPIGNPGGHTATVCATQLQYLLGSGILLAVLWTVIYSRSARAGHASPVRTQVVLAVGSGLGISAGLLAARSPLLPAALLVSSLVLPIAFAIHRRRDAEEAALLHTVESGVAALGRVRVADPLLAPPPVRIANMVQGEAEVDFEPAQRAPHKLIRRARAAHDGGFRPMPR
jgi:hypothetical protein